MAVIAALELDDLVSSGRAACQTDRAHDRLRSRIDHADHLDAGQHGDHLLRHFDLKAGRRAEGKAADHAVIHRLEDIGVAVPEDHRPPRADIVDIFQSVSIQNVAAEALYDKTGSTADRTERADRRVDAAGQHFAAPLKQLFRVRHISRCLPSEWRPPARTQNK